MKTTLSFILSVSGVLAAPPVLPRPTAQNLAELRQATPMRHLEKPSTPETRVARNGDQSFIEQSVILNDGTHWTILPRGAVISLPQALRVRVDAEPAGTLLAWIDFLALNCSWITTHEVSMDQAAGKVPLPAHNVLFWSTQKQFVVAVHQGGPISVLPAKQTLAATRP